MRRNQCVYVCMYVFIYRDIWSYSGTGGRKIPDNVSDVNFTLQLCKFQTLEYISFDGFLNLKK